MVRLERDLMAQVSQRLGVYKCTGDVLWYSRLQCGKIKVGYHWIKLCDKGTPDWLTLVRNKNNGITALFIECKSNKGKLRKEQEEFFEKYHKLKDIHVLVMTDILELDSMIDFIIPDRIKVLTL